MVFLWGVWYKKGGFRESCYWEGEGKLFTDLDSIQYCAGEDGNHGPVSLFLGMDAQFAEYSDACGNTASSCG